MPRVLLWAVALAALFAATAVVLLQLMRAPHRPTDYLVAGGLATLVCLLAAFLAVATRIGAKPTRRVRK